MKTNSSHHLDKSGNHTKFGKVDDNGIIIVPSRLTLKWIPNYYYKLNEPKSVNIMYIVTSVFCLVGILIF